MPEAVVLFGAIGAGASCGVAVFAVAGRREGIDAATWLARRQAGGPVQQQSVARRSAQPAADTQLPGRWLLAMQVARARDRLVSLTERAGWKESPERLTAFALALASCMTVLGVASASIMPISSAGVLGALGFASAIGFCALGLRSAVARRRRRLAAELVPLLELFTLELSGGGSALSALGSVTTKVQGELASDLRGLLIAAHVVGSVPFESRLTQYSEHLDIPALASLATIMGASREYGTGVIHGVRALATDQRHAQRRELIAHSRRALNHVLIPAAVGVLLPFLAVVMFPAVTALQRNLH
jgi:Flp pilus assembly protein TadB